MSEKEIFIKVAKDGPYLVYGFPKITTQKILTDENGVCIDYSEGEIIKTQARPVALCRCGKTKNAPFCDYSHVEAGFDGTETAPFEPILDNAVKFHGKNLTLADNEQYCAYARFCDAKGSIWNLIIKGEEQSDKDAVKEANLCPSGRLVIFDKNGNMLEDELEKSISILEDDGLKLSGPIWVRGGIRIESSEGKSYEIRNRQTLCRCGLSTNKPFCNCAHAHNNFKAQKKEDN